MAPVVRWTLSCATAALVSSALLAAHLVFGLDVQKQQAEEVGKAFVVAYYQMFESDRAGLGSLYEAQSMLTFEGQTFIGAQAIAQKLQGLPLNQSRIHLSSLDAQPPMAGGVLVLVTGTITVSILKVF